MSGQVGKKLSSKKRQRYLTKFATGNFAKKGLTSTQVLERLYLDNPHETKLMLHSPDIREGYEKREDSHSLQTLQNFVDCLESRFVGVHNHIAVSADETCAHVTTAVDDATSKILDGMQKVYDQRDKARRPRASCAV